MNLKEQQYVCVLAQCQNLTKAAQALFISQPALSIYINNLESNLGVKLFERIGKRFVLTYAGERYVETAEKMLALKEGFDRDIQEITGNYKGRLRIGIQTRRSTWFLPPVIAAYEKEFPHMDVIVMTGNMEYLKDKLHNYELDLFLCNAADADPSTMTTHLIYKEQLLVAVPPDHPVNEKAVYVPGKRYRYLDLSYLQGETLVLQRPGQSIRKDADRLLKEKNVTPCRIRELESIETAMQFVAEGLGIGFNREGYTINMSYNKTVNYYAILSKEETIDFVLAHRKNLLIDTPTQRMIDMLIEQGQRYYQ